MYKVVGFKPVEYDRKKDGKHVKGTTLYVIDKEDRPGVVGFQCTELWVSQNCTYAPVIGDNVRIFFNRFGSVEDVVSQGEQ